MCSERHTSCSTSLTSLLSLDRFSPDFSCDVRQAVCCNTSLPEGSFRPAGQQTARWLKLIAATTQCMFTLLIKIFVQSRLISNILPIVQQIDCTDLRIIFSLHILVLSTSFLLLILLLQGERSGHKRE